MTNLVPWRLGRRAVRPFSWDVSEFDRFVDDMWRGFGLEESRAGFTPRVDVHEDESEYRITAELPGLEEKDFAVSLEEGVLTIKGEKRSEREEERGGYRHVESASGSFERRLALPEGIDADKVEATFRNGVLTVTLPKTPEARPEVRTIPVTTA